MAPLIPSPYRSLHPVVHRELVDLLHTAQPQVAAIATMALTGAAALALSRGDAGYGLVTLAILVTAIIRLTALRRYPRSRPLLPQEVLRWERIYGTGCAAFGLALGMLSHRALTLGDERGAWVAFGLAMSFCVGMVSRAAVRPWVVLLTAALLLTPIILAGTLRPEMPYKLGAAMLVFFWVTLREASRHLSTSFVDRLEAKRALAHQANHDLLTGLPNRAAFMTELQALSRAPGGAFAIIAIDLDGFKPINDQLGHHAGDALLQLVAQRLRACAGSRALATRFGGDEFMLLLRLPGSPSDVETAQRLGRKAVASLSRPFMLDGRPIRIGASAGILVSCEQEPQGDVEDLLARADGALYAAKRAGGGRWHQASPQPRTGLAA